MRSFARGQSSREALTAAVQSGRGLLRAARLLDRCFGSCRPAAPAQHMVQCRGVVLLLAALPSLVCGLLQRPNLWIIVADGESAVRPSVRTRYGQAVANAERA
jgi:hypothetical protein